MSLPIQPNRINSSEFRGQEVKTVPLSSLNEEDAQISKFLGELNHDPLSYLKKVVLEWRPIMISNLKAFASRLLELCLRPEEMAPIVLDLGSLLRSIIWAEKRLGLDLLYPFSSLKKHKPGRLARLLLDHSRDQYTSNLHNALSSRDAIDPPRVAVIDLDEVPPEIIARGYTVSADFYGFAVTLLLLEILISLYLHTFCPIDYGSYSESVTALLTLIYGNRLGSWFASIAVQTPDAALQMWNTTVLIFALCVYVALRGDGTLSLVWRPDVPATGCAVLLDVNFALILTGDPKLVDAIAESTFSISHPLARKYQVIGWHIFRSMGYGALQGLCKGSLMAIPTGFCLLLAPKWMLVSLVVMLLATLMGSMEFYRLLSSEVSDTNLQMDMLASLLPKICFVVIPPLQLVSAHIFHQAITKYPVFALANLMNMMIFSHVVPWSWIIVHLVSIPNYHIRTTKLLDILGHPPVRRWEFDTLAAAATFQCLVVCHRIPRPVDNVDVLSLLDTFLPDERDIWKVWKARVADRITHQVDISFVPTIPSFRDHQQKHLKELLDQAQIGYDEYRRFYDGRVSRYSQNSL